MRPIATLSLLSISILLTTYACQSARKTADAWHGKTKQELLMRLGPPNRVTDDGANGEILIYETRTQMPSQVFDSAGTRSIPISAGIVHYYQYFWIDSTRRVYHYMRKSDLEPPIPHQVQVIRL